MFLQLGISSLRRAGSDCLRLFVCAVQLADRVGANGPRDLLHRDVFLALAHFTVERAADKRAFNQDVIAFAERCSDVFTEAVPDDNAVPLGFRVPLVLRVLPGPLRGDREDGVERAVALDLATLGILPDEADDLN